MRIKSLTMLRSFVFMTLLVTLVASCKKDDDDDPDYVGTWVVLGTSSDGETTLEMKDVMILSKGSFNEKIQVKNPTNNVWLDYMGMKGTMSVNGPKMDITVTEVGLSSLNPVSGVPTGVITYYKSTDAEFNQLIEGFGMQTTFQSEYAVAGNEITIKTDYNADADYNDEGETTTYTRQ